MKEINKLKELYELREIVTTTEPQLEEKRKEINDKKDKILEGFPEFVQMVNDYNTLHALWVEKVGLLAKGIDDAITLGKNENE